MSQSGGLPVTPDPATLRYAGEEVVDRIDLDGSRIAVTTHRVLVLTPDGPGRRFRSVHRPNVTGVSRGVQADPSAGRRALQAGVYAAVLTIAGVVIDLDGLLGNVSTDGPGALKQVLGTIERLLGLLTLLDELLLASGIVAGAVAAAFAGIYLWRREREFRIDVAGDDPISLPRPDRESVVADRLRAALRGDGSE